MERIENLKAKYEGRMYDVRSINFGSGSVIICAENNDLKAGFHKNLTEVQLYCTTKTKNDE